MTSLIHEKIVKLLFDVLPDSVSEDQKYAVYEKFDENVLIKSNYETDEFELSSKISSIPLTDIEIVLWIKQRNIIPIEHVASNGKIKSTNFLQQNGADPRKLPKDIKLPKEKVIELCNIVIQVEGPKLEALSDEEFLEELCKIQARMRLCEQILSSKNIKIKEAAQKALSIEYANGKAVKSAKLEKKTPAIKLTKEQKAMKNMGLDWNKPEDLAKFQLFLKDLAE